MRVPFLDPRKASQKERLIRRVTWWVLGAVALGIVGYLLLGSTGGRTHTNWAPDDGYVDPNEGKDAFDIRRLLIPPGLPVTVFAQAVNLDLLGELMGADRPLRLSHYLRFLPEEKLDELFPRGKRGVVAKSKVDCEGPAYQLLFVYKPKFLDEAKLKQALEGDGYKHMAEEGRDLYAREVAGKPDETAVVAFAGSRVYDGPKKHVLRLLRGETKQAFADDEAIAKVAARLPRRPCVLAVRKGEGREGDKWTGATAISAGLYQKVRIEDVSLFENEAAAREAVERFRQKLLTRELPDAVEPEDGGISRDTLFVISAITVPARAVESFVSKLRR